MRDDHKEFFAIVTTQGICFEDRLYSCQKALKEKWYERALDEGWLVPVFQYRGQEDLLFLRSDSSLEDHIECFPICNVSIDVQTKQSYYTNLQKLKKIRRSQRKRKEGIKL